MTPQTVILIGATQREYARRLLNDAPLGSAVVFKPATRSDDQNRKLWPMLSDVAKQVEWYGRHLRPDDWKHMFTSYLRKLDVVPNIDGTGFVALGLSTSQMGKREFSDLITLIFAFGAEKGVVWSDPMEWRE